jgi:hypothetical protein
MLGVKVKKNKVEIFDQNEVSRKSKRGIPVLEQHAPRNQEHLTFCETVMTSGLLWNLT